MKLTLPKENLKVAHTATLKTALTKFKLNYLCCEVIVTVFNPLTPKSDQYQYIVKQTGDENNKTHQLRVTALV